ncbi:fibronectin type III domain-containing protein [Persicobacter diffluens]|uniref:Uncharacterized protein n=1 Tax=Persicobacter diffluens TaxID=981 RepID=A0AAN5AN11_9BACT|nr:hypothetical protein PEDI_48990 [Persicobacter diffluens]
MKTKLYAIFLLFFCVGHGALVRGEGMSTQTASAYRFLRLTVLDKVGTYDPNIAEIAWVANGTTYPQSNYSVSATVASGSANSAYDKNTGTIWGQLTALPAAITLELNTDIVPSQLQITPAYEGRAAAAFRAEVSADGNNWITATEVSGLKESDWTKGVAKSFSLDLDTNPDTEAPTAPSNLSASNVSTNSVSLSWGASSDNVGVDKYEVYQDNQFLATASNTNYTVSGLQSSSTYNFHVIAKDAAGNASPKSNTLSVTTEGNSGGQSFRYLRVTVLDGTTTYDPNVAQIAWIEQGTTYPKSGYSVSATVSNSTAKNAYDGNLTSLWGTLTSLPASITLDLGSSTTIDPSAIQITPAWEGRAFSSFTAEGSTDGNIWQTLLQVNGLKEGDWQREVAKTFTISQDNTPDTEAPTTPGNLQANAVSSSSIALSWNASTDNVGVTAYDIYQNNNFKASTANTSYTVSGLSANTTYTYYVRAKDAAGNVSNKSNEASATTNAGSTPPSGDFLMGINVHGVNDYEDVMFKNVLKQARPWRTSNSIGGGDNTFEGDKMAVDQDGYPLEVPLVGLQAKGVHTVLLTTKEFHEGKYIVLWDGQGTLDFSGSKVKNEQLVAANRMEVTIEMDGTTAPVFMHIKSSQKGNHVRNIRVLAPGTESSYQQQPFDELFLQELAPFPVLRLMDMGTTNFNNIENWSDRIGENYYSYSTSNGFDGRHDGHFTPYEVMAQLANITDKDIWVCVPHKVGLDRNYLRNMAQVFKDHLNSHLKVYVEYSNETWNGQFTQNGWIYNLNDAEVSSLNFHQKRAYISGICFNEFRSVLGNSRVIRVLGAQRGQSGNNRTMLNQLNGNVDMLSTANYFRPKNQELENLRNLGYAVTLNDLDRETRGTMYNRDMPDLKSDADLAKEFGVELFFYEGGQHLVTLNSQDEKYGDVIVAMQNDDRIYDLTMEWYAYAINDLKVAGGCYFNLASSYSPKNSFGMQEYLGQPLSEAPKKRAVYDILENKNLRVGKPLAMEPGFESQGIYPNPSRGLFRLEEQLKEYQIYNTAGGRIQVKISEEGVLNLSAYPAGMYLLQGVDQHGHSRLFKLIKQ